MNVVKQPAGFRPERAAVVYVECAMLPSGELYRFGKLLGHADDKTVLLTDAPKTAEGKPE